MGNRIELPSEDVVPPGPYRHLITELHRLYRAAGRPGLRTLSRQIQDDNDLPATLSHEAIRQILRGVGGVPRFPTLKSLVWVLARHAQPPRDPGAEVERFLHLWEAAGEFSAAPALPPRPPIEVQSLPYTPEAVHSRLVSIVTEALDGISAEAVPSSIRGFARYAPDKQATLSTAVFLAWLRDHHEFRAALVNWCRDRRPEALETGGADPVAATAAALLLDESAADYYLAVTTRQTQAPRPQLPTAAADVDTVLKPTSAHLIVNGHAVYPDLSTEDQMDVLVRGLAMLGERTGAEVTVVFGSAKLPVELMVVPRGVRVLYCEPGQQADQVVAATVRAEPSNRPVLMVTASESSVDIDERPMASYISPSALAARLEELD